ncbi:MAG: YciI family protein [Nevskia sp.]
MQHFLIEVNYLVPLERIQQSSAAHRVYILSGIDQGLILCAGPRQPREGGFVLARADSQATLEHFFASDPYLREGLAEYRYRAFAPLYYQSALADWVGPA